jgi:uncharacterized repeat protein (TIGR03803 family)
MSCKSLLIKFGMFSATLAILVLASGTAAGTTHKVLYQFKGGADGSTPKGPLVLDAAGNLYGTTARGGTSPNCVDQFDRHIGCGTIFKLLPNADGTWTKSTIYNFTGGKNWGGTDGANPNSGLVFDAAGNLYGTTVSGGANSDRYFNFNYVGGTVFKLKLNPDGSWTETPIHSFGQGSDGYWAYGGVVFDNAGNLYGTTYFGGTNGGGVVYKLSPNADETWTETVIYNVPWNFKYPKATLVFDEAGNLYGATDGGWPRGLVFKLTPNPDETWTESDIASTESDPWAGVIADSAGNLYGASPNGGITQGTGSCNPNSAWFGCGVVFKLTQNADGTWAETVLHQFSGPDGVRPIGVLALDGSGALYGTTLLGGGHGGGAVFKLTPEASGNWKFTLLWGLALPSAHPSAGVTLDRAGNVYGTTEGDGTSTFGTVFEITP